MKILFDTNIVVDLIDRREPFFQKSREVFMQVVDGKIAGIIGAGSITDVYYIVRKSLQSAELALLSIRKILTALTLIDTTAQDIRAAIDTTFPDFEDAVIAAAAERENADFIITRNVDDFVRSSVPALTPTEFLAKYIEF